MSNQVTREQNNWTAVTRSESNFERMYREQKKKAIAEQKLPFCKKEKAEVEVQEKNNFTSNTFWKNIFYMVKSLWL